MAYGRKNHVKVDPTSYSFMLLGEPKCGKTTVMKEALEIMELVAGVDFNADIFNIYKRITRQLH